MPELKGMLVGLFFTLIFLAFSSANWGLGSDNFFSASAKREFSRVSEIFFMGTGAFLVLLLLIEFFSEAVSEARKNPKIVPIAIILISSIFLTALVWVRLGIPEKAHEGCPHCNLVFISIDGLLPEETGAYDFKSPTGKLKSVERLSSNALIFKKMHSPITDGTFSEELTIHLGRTMELETLPALDSTGALLIPTGLKKERSLLFSRAIGSQYTTAYFSDHRIGSGEGNFLDIMDLNEMEIRVQSANSLGAMERAIESLDSQTQKFAFYARTTFLSQEWDAALSETNLSTDLIRVDASSGKVHLLDKASLEPTALYKGEAEVSRILEQRKKALLGLDKRIDSLLSVLEKKGFLKDTVIVITSSSPQAIVNKPQSIYNRADGTKRELPYYYPFSWESGSIRASNIPLIIHIPKSERKYVETLSSSSEIVKKILPNVNLHFYSEAGAENRTGAGSIETISICNTTITNEGTSAKIDTYFEKSPVYEEGYGLFRDCCAECPIRKRIFNYDTREETTIIQPISESEAETAPTVENVRVFASRKA